jgi:hypothetical protein
MGMLQQVHNWVLELHTGFAEAAKNAQETSGENSTGLNPMFESMAGIPELFDWSVTENEGHN